MPAHSGFSELCRSAILGGIALLLSIGATSCSKASTEDSSSTSNEESMAADPIAELSKFIEEKKLDIRGGKTPRTSLPQPPQVQFDPTKLYFWDLETNFGPIRVRLMPDVAPMHASSTVYLTTLGYFDGLAFHRVIPRFMAQGGCPLGTGTGSPGYKYAGEFSPGVKHDRPGLLSMANSGPNTDGSQFFLTFVPTPHLDGLHTIFGEVVGDEGLESLKKIEARGTPGGRTTEKVVLEKATITVE